MLSKTIYKLKDLGRVVTGRTPPGAHPEYFGTDVPFVTPTDMDGRRRIDRPGRFLSAIGSERLKSILIPQGVAVSCIGWQMGKAVLIDRLSATNQQINTVVPNPSLVDRTYLYYELLSRREEIFRLGAGGSRTPILNKSGFENLEVWLPPLAEQQAIAHILGTLDDKIELNRKTNETLEAMAKATFKSWFIDFDPVHAKAEGRTPVGMDLETSALFPIEFEVTELGTVPKGWEVRSIADLAAITSGKRPTERYEFQSPDAPIPLYGGGGIMAYVSSALWSQPVLLTGRVGTLGLVFRIVEPCWPSDNTLVVVPFSVQDFDYVRFHLEQIDLQGLNRGSTQPLLTQRDLGAQRILVANTHVRSAFSHVVNPLFDRVVSNVREIAVLTALRDLLLPKLLSGEIRISEAEKQLETVL